jgi:hypothetical protein
MNRGYVKVWRKLEDSGLLQMHSTLALFMYLLLKASHKSCRVGMTELKRGQYISGRHKLAEAIGVTERQARTCLDRLHELNILTSESTNHFTIYTIVNYSEYQDDQSDSDQQIDQQATSKRPTSDQLATSDRPLNKHLNTKAFKKETSEDFILPDWIDKSHWDLWMQTRKGKKMIAAQKMAQVAKLEQWKAEGRDYAQALFNSASAGWQGLFEPKGSTALSVIGSQNDNLQVREAARKRLFGEGGGK